MKHIVLKCSDLLEGNNGDKLPYDSIIASYNEDYLLIKYYSMKEVSKEERYLSGNGCDYNYNGTISGVDADSISSYFYLFFSEKDTSFVYKYTENENTPPVPVGSRDVKVSIIKNDNCTTSSRKYSVVGFSLVESERLEFFNYSYPFKLLSICVTDERGSFLYK